MELGEAGRIRLRFLCPPLLLLVKLQESTGGGDPYCDCLVSQPWAQGSSAGNAVQVPLFKLWFQGQDPNMASVLPVQLWARWIFSDSPFLCSRNYQHSHFTVEEMEVHRGEVNRPLTIICHREANSDLPGGNMGIAVLVIPSLH